MMGCPSGNTLNWYSLVCLSKISKQGIETTLASIPFAASTATAATMMETSDPVATRVREAEAGEERTYPPRLAFSIEDPTS